MEEGKDTFGKEERGQISEGQPSLAPVRPKGPVVRELVTLPMTKSVYLLLNIRKNHIFKSTIYKSRFMALIEDLKI